ncbi:MAG: hypothetical protein IJA19_04920 [Clostridia bacterium]|nr:hypothetical protein [Clostridia bacterium]
MDYKEFCEDFKRRLVHSKRWHIQEEDYRFFPQGYTAEPEFVRETNLTYFRREADELLGDFALVTIRDNDEAMGECRFHLKALYEEYQDNGWKPIVLLVDRYLKTIKESRFKDVTEKLNDYEATKERLMIRPVNYTDHKYDLTNSVFRLYGDVALVLYYVLSDNGKDLNTFKMHRDIVESWDKDIDDVFDEALSNTQMMALPRMYKRPLETVNPPYHKGAFLAMNSDVECIKPHEVPLLTTTRKLNGAVAVFYPGVLKRISQLYGNKSFFVVFTSIDDARIHCEGSISPRMILRQLRDLNRMFDRRQVLSDKVFFYDCERRTFRVLDL